MNRSNTYHHNTPYNRNAPPAGPNAARWTGVTSWGGTGGPVHVSNKPPEQVGVFKRAPTPEAVPTPRAAPSQKKAKVDHDSGSEFGDDDLDHTVIDSLLIPYEHRKPETPEHNAPAVAHTIKNWREEGAPPKRAAETLSDPRTPKSSKTTRVAEAKTPTQSKTAAQRSTSLPETPVSKPHYEVNLRTPLPAAPSCGHTHCQCAGAVDAAGRNKITDAVFEACSPSEPGLCWDKLPSVVKLVDTSGMCTIHRYAASMARSIGTLRRELEAARGRKRAAMEARTKLRVKGDLWRELDGGWGAHDEDELLALSLRLHDQEKVYAALVRMRLPVGWKGDGCEHDNHTTKPENWLPLPAHLCPAKHTNRQCYFRLPDFLPVAVTRSTCAQHRKIVATILHINCMRVAIDTVRSRGVGVDDAWIEALVAAMMEHDALVLAQGF
ncbi:uncharacterized protein LOC62_06G008079 [Vanrija pseudolonga]|uniref:Uncharacterized protein n=1 Tax=Vanrija pseudolonga TaxID=143232 RepID=A0AAF0YGU2_9TREE|nr:hypothetical protein LOC62_06G008079 [Vanrija pseudolonga]